MDKRPKRDNINKHKYIQRVLSSSARITIRPSPKFPLPQLGGVDAANKQQRMDILVDSLSMPSLPIYDFLIFPNHLF